jgi:hypothetical protein
MAVKKFSTDSSIKNSFKLSRGATSVAKPEAPTIGAVAAGATPSTQVTVAYTAATLGAAGSTFTATSTPSSITGTGASPITVSGLSPSTSYTFTVKANNANGDSPLSAASSSITTDVSPSDYESISTVTVGSGGSATVDFTSIPATYTHLQVRCIARGTSANAQINMPFRMNNDTTSNYRTHILYSDGSSVASFDFGSITGVYLNYMPAANTSSNIFGAAVIDILDYTNTNKTKVFRYLQGMDANGSGNMNFYSGLWNSTAAINRITFTIASGNFAEYSQFALYGIKS